MLRQQPVIVAVHLEPDINEGTKGFLRPLHALKRMAEPKEMVKAALFLTLDSSSLVTGSARIAEGGNSINKV